MPGAELSAEALRPAVLDVLIALYAVALAYAAVQLVRLQRASRAFTIQKLVHWLVLVCALLRCVFFGIVPLWDGVYFYVRMTSDRPVDTSLYVLEEMPTLLLITMYSQQLLVWARSYHMATNTVATYTGRVVGAVWVCNGIAYTMQVLVWALYDHTSSPRAGLVAVDADAWSLLSAVLHATEFFVIAIALMGYGIGVHRTVVRVATRACVHARVCAHAHAHAPRAHLACAQGPFPTERELRPFPHALTLSQPANTATPSLPLSIPQPAPPTRAHPSAQHAAPVSLQMRAKQMRAIVLVTATCTAAFLIRSGALVAASYAAFTDAGGFDEKLTVEDLAGSALFFVATELLPLAIVLRNNGRIPGANRRSTGGPGSPGGKRGASGGGGGGGWRGSFRSFLGSPGVSPAGGKEPVLAVGARSNLRLSFAERWLRGARGGGGGGTSERTGLLSASSAEDLNAARAGASASTAAAGGRQGGRPAAAAAAF